MQKIMNFVHKWKPAEDWRQPPWIKKVMISSNSWKLPTNLTPVKAKVEWLFINPPTTYDDSYFVKEVDALCNWKVTENTPKDAIKKISCIRYHSLKPNWKNWEIPVYKLSKCFLQNWDLNTDKVCERWTRDSSMQVWIKLSHNWVLVSGSNFVTLAYKSKKPIIKLEILLDNKLIASYSLPGKKIWVYSWAFNLPIWAKWKKILTVKAIDSDYYSKAVSKTVNVWYIDKYPPKITLINPARWSINLKKDTSFNLRAKFDDISPIRIINVYFNGKKIFWQASRSIVIPISVKWLDIWKYNLKIEAVDAKFNIATKNIVVNVIE